MASRSPRVGFVSLGCPKALVDSERILTQLRAEGYEVSPTYDAADLVFVNTCGFIDEAVHESLDAIGEALAQNGRVRLTNAGVRELLLISQDTGAYGADLGYRPEKWGSREIPSRFLDLARELGELGPWIRLHYVYPYPHVDAVIRLMAEGKVRPYLDVPFQHGSPRILKLMRRPAHAVDTLARIRRWRETVQHLNIRSTFIVGFPGETEEDFRMVLDWLEEAELDRVGCFRYSPVEGAANALPDPVPDAVKEERWHRFMQAQQRISARRLAARVGRRIRVLVDAVDAVDDGVARARGEGDAPEIDGIVRVKGRGASNLPVGEFADVMVTGATEYDLEAKLAS